MDEEFNPFTSVESPFLNDDQSTNDIINAPEPNKEEANKKALSENTQTDSVSAIDVNNEEEDPEEEEIVDEEPEKTPKTKVLSKEEVIEIFNAQNRELNKKRWLKEIKKNNWKNIPDNVQFNPQTKRFEKKHSKADKAFQTEITVIDKRDFNVQDNSGRLRKDIARQIKDNPNNAKAIIMNQVVAKGEIKEKAKNMGICDDFNIRPKQGDYYPHRFQLKRKQNIRDNYSNHYDNNHSNHYDNKAQSFRFCSQFNQNNSIYKGVSLMCSNQPHRNSPPPNRFQFSPLKGNCNNKNNWDQSKQKKQSNEKKSNLSTLLFQLKQRNQNDMLNDSFSFSLKQPPQNLNPQLDKMVSTPNATSTLNAMRTPNAAKISNSTSPIIFDLISTLPSSKSFSFAKKQPTSQISSFFENMAIIDTSKFSNTPLAPQTSAKSNNYHHSPSAQTIQKEIESKVHMPTEQEKLNQFFFQLDSDCCASFKPIFKRSNQALQFINNPKKVHRLFKCPLLDYKEGHLEEIHKAYQYGYFYFLTLFTKLSAVAKQPSSVSEDIWLKFDLNSFPSGNNFIQQEHKKPFQMPKFVTINAKTMRMTEDKADQSVKQISKKAINKLLQQDYHYQTLLAKVKAYNGQGKNEALLKDYLSSARITDLKEKKIGEHRVYQTQYLNAFLHYDQTKEEFAIRKEYLHCISYH